MTRTRAGTHGKAGEAGDAMGADHVDGKVVQRGAHGEGDVRLRREMKDHIRTPGPERGVEIGDGDVNRVKPYVVGDVPA